MPTDPQFVNSLAALIQPAIVCGFIAGLMYASAFEVGREYGRDAGRALVRWRRRSSPPKQAVSDQEGA